MDYSKSDFRRQVSRLKSKDELIINRAVKLGFPACKGTYPDCPEIPNKVDPFCKNCPVLDRIRDK
jgi:hypothetical protein